MPLSVECLFYIVLVLFYFFEKIKYISEISLYLIPSFWISIALLISFSGTFFLYLFSISMSKDPSFKNQYHIIYGCFTIIKNTLFLMSVLVNKNVVEANSRKTLVDVAIDLERNRLGETIINPNSK